MAGNSAWKSPSRESTQWRQPGHDRMVHSDDGSDTPGRSFSTKKKHGWWGREERFDARGRRVK